MCTEQSLYKRINFTKTVKMLCACGDLVAESGSIIDIERVLTEYAWRELKKDSRWYNCLRRVDFVVEVPWNYFEFDHKTIHFTPRSKHGDTGYKERKQVELFRTDFTNSTGKDQVYKLRTQRQTKAATVVAIQKGFTLKGNTNFKLKIPQNIGHFGVSASADGYLRVTKSRGETFEETFTWQVDSDVTVEPNHVTNAKLLVTEDELVADFEVRTSMRMPRGEAPIIVKRRGCKDPYAVLMISDLREVFSDVECTISLTKSDDPKKPIQMIEFVTNGILESVRWRNQRICLESRPITDRDRRVVEQDACSTELPIYSSAIFSKVLEHATKQEEDFSSEKTDDGKRRDSFQARKDLRFNIIPTIITEVDEDTYESAESIMPRVKEEMIKGKTVYPAENVVTYQESPKMAYGTYKEPPSAAAAAHGYKEPPIQRYTTPPPPHFPEARSETTALATKKETVYGTLKEAPPPVYSQHNMPQSKSTAFSAPKDESRDSATYGVSKDVTASMPSVAYVDFASSEKDYSIYGKHKALSAQREQAIETQPAMVVSTNEIHKDISATKDTGIYGTHREVPSTKETSIYGTHREASSTKEISIYETHKEVVQPRDKFLYEKPADPTKVGVSQDTSIYGKHRELKWDEPRTNYSDILTLSDVKISGDGFKKRTAIDELRKEESTEHNEPRSPDSSESSKSLSKVTSV